MSCRITLSWKISRWLYLAVQRPFYASSNKERLSTRNKAFWNKKYLSVISHDFYCKQCAIVFRLVLPSFMLFESLAYSNKASTTMMFEFVRGWLYRENFIFTPVICRNCINLSKLQIYHYYHKFTALRDPFSLKYPPSQSPFKFDKIFTSSTLKLLYWTI